MSQDKQLLYKALTARDPRFDGVFFVGVTSTHIYCRPVCPAKTPKESNCRFFNSPQEAEWAGYRPCLRCRPELAPGSAPIDDSQRIAHSIIQRIEEGTIDGTADLEAIADQFELSSRQIRRIVHKELGVSPIQLILTRRLLLAKQLLTETTLSMTEVAFASGFSSSRRFNDAFSSRYGMSPSRLRKTINDRNGVIPTETSVLQLTYRPPYDWEGILVFLQARELKGIEWITDSFYARTVHIGNHTGWIKVTKAKQKNTLSLEFSHDLILVLPALLRRVRNLFDLNARPDVINAHLSKDQILGPMVKANPGQRVPGAFDNFEIGLRAILGQQVTVKAATTIACRLIENICKTIVTPHPELAYLTPSPENVANTSIDDIAKHGVVSSRCKSMIALAQAYLSDELLLDSSACHNPEVAIKRLTQLPGIGLWTAHYIAMRALQWTDAFPVGDVVILKRLGGITAKQAEEISQAWRPWRSYATLHLWNRMIETRFRS